MFGAELFFAEVTAIVLFLFGYAFLLAKPSLNRGDANLLLGVFASGLFFDGARMIDLALASEFAALLSLILLFIVGLLLAFVANAKGEYFASRRLKK